MKPEYGNDAITIGSHTEFADGLASRLLVSTSEHR